MVKTGDEGRPVPGQQAIEDVGVGDVIQTNAGAEDAPDGKEPGPEAEQVDQDDAGPEDRRADADQGEQHRAVVQNRRTVGSGDDPDRDADKQGDCQEQYVPLPLPVLIVLLVVHWRNRSAARGVELPT